MTSTEIDVIKAVLEGDKNQYRTLVERYKNGLTTFLYNQTHNKMVAEDLAQESFVVAFQKLSQFDTQYSFSTWLYAIASNLAKKQYKSTRQTTYFVVDNKDVDNKDPQDLAIKNDQASITRRAIKQLKPEYQDVINLFYWEDKTYAEIAYIMKQPVNTIRTWISRSKTELEANLNGLI